MVIDLKLLEVNIKTIDILSMKSDIYMRMLDDDSSDVTPPPRQSPEMTSLPDPELSNLKEIADIFTGAHTLNEKDKISTYITIEVNDKYQAYI
jgi:hypothetical protein